MRNMLAYLITAVFVALPVTGAMAQGAPLAAELSGANEVAGGDPDGTGEAFITLNPGLREVCYQLSVSDIAPATGAHIHRAPAGVNGPVVVALAAPTSGFSSGCAEGVSRELIMEIVRTPWEFYVNVHNATFPGGAVRGQLDRPIP